MSSYPTLSAFQRAAAVEGSQHADQVIDREIEDRIALPGSYRTCPTFKVTGSSDACSCDKPAWGRPAYTVFFSRS
jgi:hypothetical protein